MAADKEDATVAAGRDEKVTGDENNVEENDGINIRAHIQIEEANFAEAEGTEDADMDTWSGFLPPWTRPSVFMPQMKMTSRVKVKRKHPNRRRQIRTISLWCVSRAPVPCLAQILFATKSTALPN